MAAHRADVTALACMGPLALLATGSADASIKLWALPADGPRSGSRAVQPLQTLQGHAAPIRCLQFTPDGDMLISGDEAGGLRVWQVAGGTAGRLLHDLSRQHAAAVTSIACHPEERLFVTCSSDRTVRVWDMDRQPGACIGVHGPQGCREALAVAFASGGGALLAAFPDALRTFTLDPLQHHDTAAVQWGEVGRVGALLAARAGCCGC